MTDTDRNTVRRTRSAPGKQEAEVHLGQRLLHVGKPNMRVALALANTRTRPIWAMRTRNEAFKDRAPTAVI